MKTMVLCGSYNEYVLYSQNRQDSDINLIRSKESLLGLDPSKTRIVRIGSWNDLPVESVRIVDLFELQGIVERKLENGKAIEAIDKVLEGL